MARIRLMVMVFLNSILLAGCARHRPYIYPVCFYEASPTEQTFQQVYAPQLTAVVQTAVTQKKPIKATLSPDARWLVADVSKHQNMRISRVWPRLGCIGTALDSNGVKLEKDCVAYEQEFVLTDHYFTFGNARDAGGFDIWNESPVANTIVYCHRLKEDEQAH